MKPKYKFDELMAQKPYFYGEINGIEFYEHPTMGDEAPMIAARNGVAWSTGFYDPLDSPADLQIIAEQAADYGVGL